MAKISKTLELERLQKLKEDGILSDAEFEKMKQEILYGNDAGQTEAEIIEEIAEDEAPKKKNMALIGFGIAVALVSLIFIVVVLTLSGGKDKNENIVEEASATQEVTQIETKPDFLTNISGVWAGQNVLLSIVYNDNQLQLWIGDEQKEAKLGEVDLANETVNVILTAQKDGHEVIVTLKKKWNQDKTAFDLVLTGDMDTIGNTELKFVRKISNDDLNRFARLAKEQAQQLADSKALSEEEAQSVVENYVEQALNTVSVKSLMSYYASVVTYYDKGEIPSATVSKDKTVYLNKWKDRTASLSGEITISDGNKPSQKIATYTYDFTVANETEEITGSSIRYITFEKVGNDILVVSEKGKPISSKVTKLNEANEAENVPEHKPAIYSEPND